jgi:hypothetical protein
MRTRVGLWLGWWVAGGVAGCVDDGGGEETTAAQSESQSASATDTDAASTSETLGDTEEPESTGGDPSGTTASAETSETGDTESPPTGWCDVEQDECGGTEFEEFACDSPAICDVLIVNDPSLNEGEGPVTFDNAEAATCILEALRADTVATHRFEVEPGQQYSHDWTIEAFGDGTLVVTRFSQDDKCFGQWSTWALRRDDAYFDACLQATEAAEIYACLIDPVDPMACVDAPVQCP